MFENKCEEYRLGKANLEELVKIINKLRKEIIPKEMLLKKNLDKSENLLEKCKCQVSFNNY